MAEKEYINWEMNRVEIDRKSPKMAVKALICLSLIAIAFADDFIIEEATQKVVDECLQEKNLSQETVHEFARTDMKTATPEIKDFFFCVTGNLGAFDGNNWNMEKIKAMVNNEEEKLKEVEECLKKDDQTSEPKERNFAVVTCCMEKEVFL